MPTNKDPIYSDNPNNGVFGTLTTANTAKDGTGTVVLLFTAGANGAFIKKLTIRHIGTVPATVVRFWLNNGSTNTVAANNTLLKEIAVSALGATSEILAQTEYDALIEDAIQSGYRIYATVGTATPNGLHAAVWGGNY